MTVSVKNDCKCEHDNNKSDNWGYMCLSNSNEYEGFPLQNITVFSVFSQALVRRIPSYVFIFYLKSTSKDV